MDPLSLPRKQGWYIHTGHSRLALGKRVIGISPGRNWSSWKIEHLLAHGKREMVITSISEEQETHTWLSFAGLEHRTALQSPPGRPAWAEQVPDELQDIRGTLQCAENNPE